MKPNQLSEDIFCLPIHDRSTRLFEGLWPIDQSGITYNSYLVRDEKTVLIDLCKELFQEEYLKELRTLVDPARIDYLVINHMEPDHSGALHAFRQAAPQAIILGSAKTVKMLDDFFGITENIRSVSDGEELALGSHKLRFISAPMVHWPETMFTYEATTQTLFPCDAFGGYGIPDKGIYDGDYDDWDISRRNRCAITPTSLQPSASRCSTRATNWPTCRCASWRPRMGWCGTRTHSASWICT